MANNSPLNLNAAPFQPQFQHIINNYYQAQNHLANKLISKSSVLRIEPIVDNPKENTIFYNTLDVTVPCKKNIKNICLKSQTYQPSNDRNNDTDLLDLLIIGYCHNIKGIQMHMIPNELFVLVIKFYEIQKNDFKLIGLCSGKAGFGVRNYRIKKTVYYIPQSNNSKCMNTVISTVSNIKLPFHIINKYNIKYAINKKSKINEFTRFNVLFLQNTYKKTSLQFSAIAFNEECAFELIFPQLQKPISNKKKPSIYSSKYGLLISVKDKAKRQKSALISFSLQTWKWKRIPRSKNNKFVENMFMCLLKKENKLFINRYYGRQYFYDLNTSTFETVAKSKSRNLGTKPSFCCDETVNRRIYALSSKNLCIHIFDLNKCKWIYHTLPRHERLSQIWIGKDKNMLYGACESIKGGIFMLDLNGWKAKKKWKREKKWKKVSSFQFFQESHCDRFFKL